MRVWTTVDWVCLVCNLLTSTPTNQLWFTEGKCCLNRVLVYIWLFGSHMQGWQYIHYRLTQVDRRIKWCWITGITSHESPPKIVDSMQGLPRLQLSPRTALSVKKRHFFTSLEPLPPHKEADCRQTGSDAVCPRLHGDALLKGPFICSKLNPMTQFMI